MLRNLFRRVARSRQPLALFLSMSFVAASGCVMEEEPLPLGTEEDPLFYASDRLWASRTMFVCWNDPGSATEKRWVEEAVRGQRSWARASSVHFVGWQRCGINATGIRIDIGDEMKSEVGNAGDGVAAMELDFGADVHNRYSRCSSNGLDREECIKTVALHEFGHAIGIGHEHERGDTPASCTATKKGSAADTVFGVWDPLSIMNYCNWPTELSGFDRNGVAEMYGAMYRGDRRTGDYDGDGRDDILCHDAVSGGKRIDYASTSGRLYGTNWSDTGSWCAEDTQELHQGDFNGDGHTDLLCHDYIDGTKWVDFADVHGRFGGTDWVHGANWCKHQNARLLVGDFNGDGRDDMLCHDVATGKKWIDYAGYVGEFNGTDWSRNANWCKHGSAQLFVGDFNGDFRDDLLCHDVVTGKKWIDYADGDGQFHGTDWSREANWCKGFWAQMLVGDFNGDDRDDLLCHSVGNGAIWVDEASPQGHFWGTNWDRDANFCHQSPTRLSVGDFNGDGRDDLLCHSIATGTKWIDHANDNGRFNGVDWSGNTGFCAETEGALL